MDRSSRFLLQFPLLGASATDFRVLNETVPFRNE